MKSFLKRAVSSLRSFVGIRGREFVVLFILSLIPASFLAVKEFKALSGAPVEALGGAVVGLTLIFLLLSLFWWTVKRLVGIGGVKRLSPKGMIISSFVFLFFSYLFPSLTILLAPFGTCLAMFWAFSSKIRPILKAPFLVLVLVLLVLGLPLAYFYNLWGLGLLLRLGLLSSEWYSYTSLSFFLLPTFAFFDAAGCVLGGVLFFIFFLKERNRMNKEALKP